MSLSSAIKYKKHQSVSCSVAHAVMLGTKFRLLILKNKSHDECNRDRSNDSSPAVGQSLSYLEDESVYHSEEVHVHMYILIGRTLRVNLKVNVTCMPDDSMNLVAYNGGWTITGVSLTSKRCDNGRNNHVAKEPILKPIREARFCEWPQGFGWRGHRL